MKIILKLNGQLINFDSVKAITPVGKKSNILYNSIGSNSIGSIGCDLSTEEVEQRIKDELYRASYDPAILFVDLNERND